MQKPCIWEALPCKILARWWFHKWSSFFTTTMLMKAWINIGFMKHAVTLVCPHLGYIWQLIIPFLGRKWCIFFVKLQTTTTDQLTSSIMLAAAGWLGSSPFATFLLSSLWWSKSLCLICLVILCVLTWPHLSETSPGLNWHMVWLGVIAQYSGNPGFVVLSDLSFLLHFKASLQSLHPTGVPLQLPPNEEEKQFP